jgi:hypothetical protein
MQTQAHTPWQLHTVKRLALGALAGLAVLSGSVVAAQPAAAGPDEPLLTRNRTGARTEMFRPAYTDLWTKTYRETIAVGNNFGPSAKDEGCNADARAAGYAYGKSMLKNWWVRFEWNGRNFISVEITCRAYRDASSAPVLH